MTSSLKRALYAQGDILLEKIADENITTETWRMVANDPDGAVVVGRGEESGHRHAIYGGGAKLLLQPTPLGEQMPSELYVGHLVVHAAGGVSLSHEEHAAIPLEPGTYRVRRQRQFSSTSDARQRLVAD